MNALFAAGSGAPGYSSVVRDETHAFIRGERMNKLIRMAALAASIGIGGAAGLAATTPAMADGIYFSIGQGHYRHVGPRYHHYHHRRNHWRRGAACSPRDAIAKAALFGIVRAHVAGANRDVIQVRGHRHHRRVTIDFARAPGCPVLR